MEIFGFNRFSNNAKKILTVSQNIARELGSDIIDTDHVLLAILGGKNSVANDILDSYGVDYERIEMAMNFMPIDPNAVSKKGEQAGVSDDLKRSLESAILVTHNLKHFYLGSEHLLFGIISNPAFRAYQLIQNIDINPEGIRKSLEQLFQTAAKNIPEAGLEDDEMMMADPMMPPMMGGKKKEGSMLAKYAIDLTAEASEGKLDPVVGREKELERVIHILSRRTKNNPVLIVEPGVGKTAIVEALAIKIIRDEVPEKLRGKKIYSLDLGSVIAGTKFRGEFEDRVKKILNELEKNKNAILFIDEIHTIIGAGSAEGSMDASNMLKPALSRGKITCIGATTLDEYRKNIEKDSAFERRFQQVIIDEPSMEDTVDILKGIAQNYEDFHQVVIEKDAINFAAKLAHRYIPDRFLPDKAIDLIDEASSAVVIREKVGENSEIKKLELKLKNTIDGKNEAVKNQNFELAADLRDQEGFIKEEIEKVKSNRKDIPKNKRVKVTKEDIAKVVNNWTGIPVSKLIESDKNKFVQLESILEKKIVGQDEAISAISQAIRRSRAGISNPNRPIGSFIFLGPTGVGKTELAKVLAEEVYERKDALIKIDMSEFMERHNVSRLVGAPAGYVGYEDGGKLTEMVRKKPYSIVLFDEIEKAHPEVFNMLLQILEDGYLTDAKGRKIDFRNTIIILTSNIGINDFAKFATLGFQTSESEEKELMGKYEKMKESVLEQVKKKFNPEFINRLDKIIVFRPLGKKEIDEIVKINLADLGNRVKKEKGINLEFSKRLVEYVAEKGYDPEYGARPIRRLVENEIENKIAEVIISDEYEEGDTIKIDLKNDIVSIEKKKILVKK